MICSNSCHYCCSFPCISHILHTKTVIFIPTQLKNYRHFQFNFVIFVLKCRKLRLYDKKIGKFGFLKNGAGIGENAYQVRYGSLRVYIGSFDENSTFIYTCFFSQTLHKMLTLSNSNGPVLTQKCLPFVH